MNERNEYLRVGGIRKSFGNNEVLRGIDFSLGKGEILSIIGSSGSGKTTLLRCLNFLEQADAGVIRVGEQTLFDSSDRVTLSDEAIRQNRLNFGLVFQNFNLFPFEIFTTRSWIATYIYRRQFITRSSFRTTDTSTSSHNYG